MSKLLQSELHALQKLYNQVELNKIVPSKYKLLYKHATTYMKATGASIQIPCDPEVFGIEKIIYILDEAIIALLHFEEIGQCAISAYIT